MSISSTQTVVLKYHFTLEGIRASWEVQISDARLEMYKVSLKYFVIQDGKRVIKEHVKESRSQLKELTVAKDKFIWTLIKLIIETD